MTTTTYTNIIGLQNSNFTGSSSVQGDWLFEGENFVVAATNAAEIDGSSVIIGQSAFSAIVVGNHAVSFTLNAAPISMTSYAGSNISLSASQSLVFSSTSTFFLDTPSIQITGLASSSPTGKFNLVADVDGNVTFSNVANSGSGSGWALDASNSGASLKLGTNTTDPYDLVVNSATVATVSSGRFKTLASFNQGDSVTPGGEFRVFCGTGTINKIVAEQGLGVLIFDAFDLRLNSNAVPGPRLTQIGVNVAGHQLQLHCGLVSIASGDTLSLNSVGNLTLATGGITAFSINNAQSIGIGAVGAPTFMNGSQLIIDHTAQIIVGNANKPNFLVNATDLYLGADASANICTAGTTSLTIGHTTLPVTIVGGVMAITGYTSIALTAASTFDITSPNITVQGNLIKVTNLPNTAQSNAVFYDTVTGQLSYAAAVSGVAYVVGGNSVGSTSFLGLTTAQQLNIGTNSIRVISVDASQNVGMGVAGATTFLDGASLIANYTGSILIGNSNHPDFTVNANNLALGADGTANICTANTTAFRIGYNAMPIDIFSSTFNIGANADMAISSTTDIFIQAITGGGTQAGIELDAVGGALTLDATNLMRINGGSIDINTIVNNAVTLSRAAGTLNLNAGSIFIPNLSTAPGGQKMLMIDPTTHQVYISP